MEIVGPHVCAIKVHGDIYDKIDVDKINELKHKYNFLVIEDRKFSDIAYICLKQLKICQRYADIVTVHGICGELMVQELGKHIGILLVHSMSVQNNLIDYTYMNKVLDMKCDNLVGFVSQQKIPNYLTFTPGINTVYGTDHQGQSYRTISNCDADIFIIGRGIYEGNALENVIMYKTLCWTK